MAATLDQIEPVKPTPAESKQAGQASEQLKRVLKPDSPLRFAAQSNGQTETVEVPAPAAALLMRLLREMASGNAVTLIPIHAQLTTKQAADLLGVSRPFLIKLLNEGRIPHALVGSHRRIRFEDLMEYKQRSDADRRKALEELARDAQELGLGY